MLGSAARFLVQFLFQLVADHRPGLLLKFEKKIINGDIIIKVEIRSVNYFSCFQSGTVLASRFLNQF